MDTIDVNLPHDSLENLDMFLDHLNNIFDHMKFTMEVKQHRCIPLLDVLLDKLISCPLG
jgi:hypothetical protein